MYQAVSEYWTKAKEPEYDLNVDILLPGRSNPDKFNFNRENQFTTRTSKVRSEPPFFFKPSQHFEFFFVIFYFLNYKFKF